MKNQTTNDQNNIIGIIVSFCLIVGLATFFYKKIISPEKKNETFSDAQIAEINKRAELAKAESYPDTFTTQPPSPNELYNRPQTRQDQILRQFNVGSGAHRKLERWVKQNMNDPESYHHIASSYADKGKYLLVQIKFRGKMPTVQWW